MYLAKVIGSVTATLKVENLKGIKLLIIKPLDDNLNEKMETIVAVDTVRAGLGEIVNCVGSREASLALEEPFVPIDAAIIGVVDLINIKK